MQTSEETKDLLAAMLAAKLNMKPVGKGGKNLHDNYKYSKELDWWKAIEPHLEANGLIVTFSIGPPIELGPTLSGNQTKTRVLGDARLSHVETGQWMEISCAGDGADKTDKAVFKAECGFKKYAYSFLFGLPTSDDPERDDFAAPAKPAAKPKAAPKQPATPEARKEAQDFIRDHYDELPAEWVTKANAILAKPEATAAQVAKVLNELTKRRKKDARAANKSTNEKLEALVHMNGKEVYGKVGWDDARHGLIKTLTGKEQSIADLTQEQLSALCEQLEGMREEQARVAAQSGRASPPPKFNTGNETKGE